MSLNSGLQESYSRDQQVWDTCALAYENQIVGGHPDVMAYEAFEEDFLDRILFYLARERNTELHLYDVGCGSGRLHFRYAMKTANNSDLTQEHAKKVSMFRCANPAYDFDPLLATHLTSIGGVDFSAQMLDLAKSKLRAAGLGHLIDDKLQFEHGSAFDLEPMESGGLPVAISVCNSIGVMQGPQGAIELFKSIRRAVESKGGIAIISAYRQESVASYGLANYESTMDVSGQPRWLTPDTYASPRYTQVPRAYKRAYDTSPGIVVDVYDTQGKLVERDHTLTRDPTAARHTAQTGHICTYTDYESHWYAYDLFDQWISAHWPAAGCYHIAGKDIDSLRAEPAQLAVLDVSGHLEGLLKRGAHTGKEVRP